MSRTNYEMVPPLAYEARGAHESVTGPRLVSVVRALGIVACTVTAIMLTSFGIGLARILRTLGIGMSQPTYYIPPYNAAWHQATTLFVGESLLFALLLLLAAGSVCLLLKRPRGRMLLFIWAYITIPLEVVRTVMVLVALAPAMHQTHLGMRPAGPPVGEELVAAIAHLSLSLALPVLLLVFLYNRRIKTVFATRHPS